MMDIIYDSIAASRSSELIPAVKLEDTLDALDEDLLVIFERAYGGQIAAIDCQIKALQNQRHALQRAHSAIRKRLDETAT